MSFLVMDSWEIPSRENKELKIPLLFSPRSWGAVYISRVVIGKH
jgi:hypothetical protein